RHRGPPVRRRAARVARDRGRPDRPSRGPPEPVPAPAGPVREGGEAPGGRRREGVHEGPRGAVQGVRGRRRLDHVRQAPRVAELRVPRGVYRTMYRGRLWAMREYAGFGSAAESNARFRYLLAHGTTGLSVAFDLPTQMGYDPDDPFVRGEVGKVGVPIATVQD